MSNVAFRIQDQAFDKAYLIYSRITCQTFPKLEFEVKEMHTLMETKRIQIKRTKADINVLNRLPMLCS